jgi:putative SOS response-associated peptidase YedK
MCGRFTQTATPAAIAQQFDVHNFPLLKPRYNIAPSQPVATIRIDSKTMTRQLVLLRWGLIPSWAKDPKIGFHCINAKAETVAKKPSFRAAFRKRRCLVVATGFYEWQVQGKTKQPMWIGLKSRQPFAFAGLWEQWKPPEGDTIESCTILTTEPNELMRPIHDRMPVVLPAEAYPQWLDPTVQDVDSLKTLLRPYPSEDLIAYPVSTLVNNPRHDVPECLEPVPV